MLATPIVHDPFTFALGPLKLTGFGIAMMAAFGIAPAQPPTPGASRKAKNG